MEARIRRVDLGGGEWAEYHFSKDPEIDGLYAVVVDAASVGSATFPIGETIGHIERVIGGKGPTGKKLASAWSYPTAKARGRSFEGRERAAVELITEEARELL